MLCSKIYENRLTFHGLIQKIKESFLRHVVYNGVQTVDFPLKTASRKISSLYIKWSEMRHGRQIFDQHRGAFSIGGNVQSLYPTPIGCRPRKWVKICPKLLELAYLEHTYTNKRNKPLVTITTYSPPS